jgi:hypothetical protein
LGARFVPDPMPSPSTRPATLPLPHPVFRGPTQT